jgi:monofunctional biosynthetic peptidoglycan transglycosylase
MMKNRFKKYLTYFWKAILAFFIGSVLLVVVYRFIPVPYTILMFQRGFERVADGKSFQIKKRLGEQRKY